MAQFRRLLDGVPFWGVLALSLTLGLAPFFPEPHVWEKLRMLFAGDLTRAVDIFDFAMHGLPWLLLLIKGVLVLRTSE